MTQTELPLAKTVDPETSHQAAAKVGSFSVTHESKILAALANYGPMTSSEIGQKSGLEYMAVVRRMKKLADVDGLVERGPARMCRINETMATVWKLK